MRILKKIRGWVEERRKRKRFTNSEVYTKEFLEEIYEEFNRPNKEQGKEAIRRISQQIKTPLDYNNTLKAFNQLLYDMAKNNGGLKHD